jgi:hypothetical protein
MILKGLAERRALLFFSLRDVRRLYTISIVEDCISFG